MKVAVALPELGHIVTDGVRVQCHVCGRMFKALAPSHIRIHNMNAEDYRQEFGLNRRQPLAGAEFRDWASRHIRVIGINNKFGSIEKMQAGALKSRHLKRRLQSNLRNSEVRIGKSVQNTPNRSMSQRANLAKTLVPAVCNKCGVGVKRHLSQAVAYCEACRPVVHAEYKQAWDNKNRERLRQYWHDYDAQRRHGGKGSLENSENVGTPVEVQ